MTLLLTLDRIDRFLGAEELKSTEEFKFIRNKLSFITICSRLSPTIDWRIYNVFVVLRDDYKYCIESFTHIDGKPIPRLIPIVGDIDRLSSGGVMDYISSNPANYSFDVIAPEEHRMMEIIVRTKDGNKFPINLKCPDKGGWLISIYNATDGDSFRIK